VAGKRVDFIGDPDLLHTYSYVPDVAAALAVLGTDDRSVGQVWHLPGPETVSTRAILEMVESRVGHPVGIRVMPRLALRAMGLVSPMMRGLAEMAYEFEEPFVLDTTKFRTAFGGQTTSLVDATGSTVDAFQRSSVLATS
jgi:nucleoside-diphosphate-sugar epimerase